jgi:hypothetical protein
LLFAAPLPGYDTQSERLVTASKGAMRVLLDVLAGLVPEPAGTRRAEDEHPVLDRQLEQWARSRELSGVRPALALWAITIWSRLHGFVSLEIEGNLASTGLDANLLFDSEVTAMLTPPVGGVRARRFGDHCVRLVHAAASVERSSDQRC